MGIIFQVDKGDATKLYDEAESFLEHGGKRTTELLTNVMKDLDKLQALVEEDPTIAERTQQLAELMAMLQGAMVEEPEPELDIPEEPVAPVAPGIPPAPTTALGENEMNEASIREMFGMSDTDNVEETLKEVARFIQNGHKDDFSKFEGALAEQKAEVEKFSTAMQEQQKELTSLRRDKRISAHAEDTANLITPGTPIELATKLVDIEDSAGVDAAKGLLESWRTGVPSRTS